MRACTKCGKEPRNKTASYCKKCHNEYQKAYYKLHPQSINNSARRRHKDIRQLVINAKSKPCTDCGNEYPYYVMDLDHVQGKKTFNLSDAGRHYKSLKTVQAEIEKCEVVCANCHRARTFERLGNGVMVTSCALNTETRS